MNTWIWLSVGIRLLLAVLLAVFWCLIGWKSGYGAGLKRGAEIEADLRRWNKAKRLIKSKADNWPGN